MMSSSFDFQAQQGRTRRASMLLVFFFVLLTAGIGLTVGVVISFFLSGGSQFGIAGLDPEVVALAASVTIAIVLGAALIRTLSFGGDGARVARALGAEEVSADTQNPYIKRYLNIVEELAIAGGMPRPKVFVLRHEQGINAFAAGSDPQHAAIALTHGALAKLNRQELTGVIAHELSHIANRDSRLNIRLLGMVYGLVIVSVLGRGMMRNFLFMPRRGGRRSALPALGIGLTLIVVGSLGVLAGRILQSTVSRRRESLADATAVQFTRNPSGLANALKKIGASTAGSRIGNAHAEEARHMFFASAARSFSGLFATHPPLVERIAALDPQFDPKTDPIWTRDDKSLIRETRQELRIGPWEREV